MTDDSHHSQMRRIRLRKRLDEFALVVVLALLVLGGLGAWVAYGTHIEPGTETDQQTVATWNEQASLSHAAEVREPNPVFQEGQVLSNQPVYFTTLSPEFDGSFRYSYDASEGGALDVELAASLTIQSVDDDGNPLWSVTEPLETSRVEGVAPGESTDMTVTVDVTEAAAEADGIEDGLGATVGTTEIQVQFEATASGVVNGESVANVHREALSLEPGGATYSVEAGEDVTESHETVETFETEQSYGLLRSYGPFVLIGGALIGLVGLAGAKHTGRIPPSPVERAALEQYQQRTEFTDWISTGRVPEQGREGTEIELDSLEDLVDVAIDMDRRVIEDRETGDFLVLDEGRYYTYAVNTPADEVFATAGEATDEGRERFPDAAGSRTDGGEPSESDERPAQTADEDDTGPTDDDP